MKENFRSEYWRGLNNNNNEANLSTLSESCAWHHLLATLLAKSHSDEIMSTCTCVVLVLLYTNYHIFCHDHPQAVNNSNNNNGRVQLIFALQLKCCLDFIPGCKFWLLRQMECTIELTDATEVLNVYSLVIKPIVLFIHIECRLPIKAVWSLQSKKYMCRKQKVWAPFRANLVYSWNLYFETICAIFIWLRRRFVSNVPVSDSSAFQIFTGQGPTLLSICLEYEACC